MRLAIRTDAHVPSELAHIIYGVALARLDRCGPDNILNTRSLADLTERYE